MTSPMYHNSDVSALAAEIFYSNVERFGVPAGDQNAQDAAIRQAYAQYADLLSYAAEWDKDIEAQRNQLHLEHIRTMGMDLLN